MINSIEFHYEVQDFQLKDVFLLEERLRMVAFKERRKNGTHKLNKINYIFVTDKFLKILNKTHLNHNYFTDILTFDMSDTTLPASRETPKLVTGEVYISVDRVKENAKTYKVSFEQELYRVILHGLLHLFGYDDKTEADKKIMRQKEDEYLVVLNRPDVTEDF